MSGGVGFGGLLWFTTWLLFSAAIVIAGVSWFRVFVKEETKNDEGVPLGVQIGAYLGIAALAIFVNAIAYGLYALAHSG